MGIIRDGEENSSRQTVYERKKGIFGGPVEHMYIDIQGYGMYVRRIQKKKKKFDHKKIGTWEGRKKCTN